MKFNFITKLKTRFKAIIYVKLPLYFGFLHTIIKLYHQSIISIRKNIGKSMLFINYVFAAKSTYGIKLLARVVAFASLLQNNLRMKKNLFLLLTMAKFDNPRLITLGLALLSVLTISNLFLVNQVYAQSSYISLKFAHLPQDGDDALSDSLYIKSTDATYPDLYANFRFPQRNRHNWTAQVKWYVDDRLLDQSEVVNDNNEVMLMSQFGVWHLHKFGGPNSGDITLYGEADNVINRKIYFDPNDSAINSLVPGSKARVELILKVTRTGAEVTNMTVLNIEHNSTIFWDTNSSTELFEHTGSATLNDDKEATLKTFHTPTSELSFKSKLYDGAAAVDEQTLTESQAGGEWTYTQLMVGGLSIMKPRVVMQNVLMSSLIPT